MLGDRGSRELLAWSIAGPTRRSAALRDALTRAGLTRAEVELFEHRGPSMVWLPVSGDRPLALLSQVPGVATCALILS